MSYIIFNPWELRSALENGSLDKHPPKKVSFIDGASVVGNNKTDVYCSISGKKLNYKSFDWKQNKFYLLELPGPAMDGDAKFHENMHVQSLNGQIVNTFDLVYPANKPNQIEIRSICFDSLLNAAYFLRANVLKSDKAMPPTIYLEKVLEEICSYVDNDPARQAAIVDMADKLPLHLEKITKQPRRTLKRIRDQERIQRVREMDKACLINLARRPGVAIAEKAGPRQRILAVRREETNNTLENRVVRHCCFG